VYKTVCKIIHKSCGLVCCESRGRSGSREQTVPCETDPNTAILC
jgi:hypothetical protein